MVHHDRRRRLVRRPDAPGSGSWLWHVKAMPTHHPVIHPHPMLEKLEAEPAPMPRVTAQTHPLADMAEAYGLEGWIRLVESR